MYGNLGYGVEPDERAAVLAAVVIGTFHQCTLRKKVAHLEVGGDRSVQVTIEHSHVCCIVVFFHLFSSKKYVRHILN